MGHLKMLKHYRKKLSGLVMSMTKLLPSRLLVVLIISCIYPFISSCSSEKSNNQPEAGKASSLRTQTGTKKEPGYSGVWQKPGVEYKWVPMWVNDSKLIVPRASPAKIVVNGYIYVLGGGASSGKNKIIYSSVEFARIQADGSLGSWKMTSSMNIKRNFAAAVAAKGHIYVIGGEKGYSDSEDLLDTVERAKILPDGSLGPWKMEEKVMNTYRRALVASYYNGWIYAFGGYNGIFLKDIERARINPDGSLQEWVHEPEEAINERYIHSGVIYKNFVYLFGGHAMSSERGMDSAEVAAINLNGALGLWQNLSHMPTKRFGGDAVVLHGTVYVIGGQNTIPLSSVDKTAILNDGKLGKWSKDTPLRDARVGVALVAGNDVVYAIGGYGGGKYLTDVQRTYYVSGKPLGSWVNDPKLISAATETEKGLPLDAKNHFNIGLQKYMEKQYDRAIVEFQLGIEVKEGFAQPHNFLGLAYQAKKMHEKAVTQYKRAIQLLPSLLPAYFNLANTYLEMGMLEESENLYRETVRLEPRFTAAKVKLLQLLARTDRCAETESELRLLAETNPQDDAIQELIKQCNFLFGRKLE